MQFQTPIHNTHGFLSNKLARLVRNHYATAFEANGALNQAIASDLLMNDSYRAHSSEPYHAANFMSVVQELLEIEERSENEPVPIPATQLTFIELKVSM